jgi:hypothetical protein
MVHGEQMGVVRSSVYDYDVLPMINGCVAQ